MFKLTPPQAQQPKHVSLTDFIRDSKKAKGRRSGSPSSPDLNWASSERGKRMNLDSDSDDDNCSSIDDKIDRGVVQRKRSSSKSSSSSLSSSTSTQAHLLSTIVFLILLFSSVDNDLLPASLSSFAEHIIYPERFMTPRSSFRFFKLPHFGFIAVVSYLLITLIFSVISTLYQSRLASTISKSISKLFVRPRQQVDERRTTAARPHSSALTSNNFIEEESDSICSDCGRPWSMHEDWGGKLVSDKDSNATETETDHDDDDNNNDDDDDDLELTRESKKKTKLTTKKAASFPSSHFASKASKLMISDDDEKVINLENDDDDDENEDGDDERDDDLSSSVPSIRRSSRAHTSPARFE